MPSSETDYQAAGSAEQNYLAFLTGVTDEVRNVGIMSAGMKPP
jgi:hypothetical protein